MSKSTREPVARQVLAPGAYGFPAHSAELLPWSFAQERLAEARNYWLGTTCPDGRPHVTPVWGVWLDNRLYFDGMPTTRWASNLAQNPHAAVHLESAEQVVIVEGAVEDGETDEASGQRIVEAWNAKYGRLAPDPAGDGLFWLVPRTARGWGASTLVDGTAWDFH